jgi:hypothetical protein
MAPAERVWALLCAPETYGEWWDARTESVTPPGPATPGQVIRASAAGLGKRWPVTIRVEGVDEQQYTLDLHTRMPLGIALRNHLVVQPLDAETSRLTFG